MDEELRALEKRYRNTGYEEDLDKLNRHRKRIGLPLERTAGFIKIWAYRIAEKCHTQLQLEDGSGNGWRELYTTKTFSLEDAQGEIRMEDFRGILKFEKLNIDTHLELQVNTRTFEETIRIAFQPPTKNSQGKYIICPWQAENYCGRNDQKLIAYVSTEDIHLLSANFIKKPVKIHEAMKIPNTFINQDDLLNHILKIYAPYLENALKEKRETLIEAPFEENFKCYLYLNRNLSRNIFKNKNSALEKVFEEAWFHEKLRRLSSKIEEKFNEEGIYFDLEQYWPITLKRVYGGYELEITTGYNDEINIEDGAVPETDYGLNRGDVSEVAREFGHVLDSFTTKIDNFSWEEDYEIKEFDRETGEISFSLKGARLLTIPLLQYICSL